MLTRKKSVVSCFVIGALLCTLTPGGDVLGSSLTVSAHQEAQSGIQDIRKASLEENTREFVTTAIKSTEDGSHESTPVTAVARIAGASVSSGAASYETAAAEPSAQSEVVRAASTGLYLDAAVTAEVQTTEEIAPELENKVITTVDTYQNIRLEPSEEAEIVGRLYEGSAGEVLETRDGWTKISSGGVEGWVHNEYVVSGEEAQDFAEEALDQVAVITDEGVRVREEASVDSTWIGVVNTDEVYKVVEEEAEAESVQETADAEAETAEAETEDVQETADAETEAETAVQEDVAAQTTAADQEAEADGELKWVKILYDGDKEGYVCADYVTTSFDLGQAKSMEEIRAEEEAQAEAEREAEEAAQAAEAETASAEPAAQAQADTSDSGWVSLGEFKITAYCGGACCNGKWAGTTASGATPAEGRTIAVAPWIIPYGTEVMIDGMGVYVAEDTGGFANRNPYQIDLFVADHASAASWGVQYHEVWIRN